MDESKLQRRWLEPDLADMMISVLMHWKKMIIVMIVGAMIVGGYYTAKTIHNGDTDTQAEENVEDNERQIAVKLSDLEKKNVEDVLYYEQLYQTKEDYFEQSVLMQADPLHVYVADMIYIITCEDFEKAYNIVDLYEGLVSGVELNNIVSKETGMVGTDGFIKLVYDGATKIDGSSTIHIRVTCPEEKTCLEIAGIVNQYIQKKKDEVSTKLGEYDITLSEKAVNEIADTDLMNKQKNYNDELISLNSVILSSIDKFTDNEKAYYSIKKGEIDNQEEEYGVGNQENNLVSSIAKYMIVGAILFCIIYVFFSCLLYIWNDKLKLSDDFENLYGIQQLSLITKKRKSSVFAPIDNYFMRMRLRKFHGYEEEEALEFTCAVISMMVSKEHLKDLYLIGCNMSQRTLDICEEIKNNVKNANIHITDNILYNAENLNKVQTAEKCILVETAESTPYEMIAKQIAFLNKQQIDILGGIVVEK